jgi:hypothetical protein
VGIWQPAGAQSEAELRDAVALLQTELAERLEREHVHEVEIGYQRRELALRFEYQASLEERLRECGEQIRQQDEAGLISADRRRLAGELADAQQEATVAWAARDQVQAQLDAERCRVSHRTVQRAVAWLQRHRVVRAAVKGAVRVVTTRSNVSGTPPAGS